MKKFLVLLALSAFFLNSAEAKDYAKMQIKEMKHAQKYGTTKQIVKENQVLSPNIYGSTKIKDPKIMKFGNYEFISDTDYNAKLKADEVKYSEYEKALGKKRSKYYTTQTEIEDFYHVYRIVEKLIRANKLDYMNWRICIYKDTENFNAYTNDVNYVAISTALLDTFKNNDDAMAMVIGHEMGHALLGHLKRTNQLVQRMNREAALAKTDNTFALAAYAAMKRKYLIDSKNMEYAADVEGAKLALHAGYDLQKGADILNYISVTDIGRDFRKTHPDGAKRLQNYNENIRYFPEGWKDLGKYNIYNSDVLPVQMSSDNKSMIISPSSKISNNQYYNPETMEEVYARFGYMYYINGQFEKSIENFNELFKLDQSNAAAYLYASYASEALYNNTKNSKYLNMAKEYISKAQKLDSGNKYIIEQVNAL